MVLRLRNGELFFEKFVTTNLGADSSEFAEAGQEIGGALIDIFFGEGDIRMSEFEKVEKEANEALVPVGPAIEEGNKSFLNDEFIGDLKMQAQEYQQKIQDAAMKAKDFANEKFTQAGEKFKELQNKDPKEILEDAKEYARQKPGQTILISAAVGLVLGLLLRGGRK